MTIIRERDMRILAVMAAFLFFSGPAHAWDADAGADHQPGQKRETLRLRGRIWLADSSVETRNSVQVPPELITPPGEVWLGETDKITGHGTMAVFSAELAPVPWLSGEVQYGQDRARGRYEEHYWVHAPDAYTLTYAPTGAVWQEPNHEDDLVYGARSYSRRDWLAANLYWRVLNAKFEAAEEVQFWETLDLAVGFERFRQDSHLDSLRVDKSLGKYYPTLPTVPIPGFDSSYSASWQGMHVGVREELYGPRGFSMEGSFFWSPFMTYRGEGFDNRYAASGDLRGEAPNYSDRAPGAAVHFQLGAAWSVSRLRLEAGYQRLYFYSRTGRRYYYNAAGGTTEHQLEYATTRLDGLYAGATLRF